jgi:quercetin dioxygenase-like cupin family protein
MAQPHARSGEVVKLAPLGEQLALERSTAILKSEQLEVVRIVLPKGKSFPQHSVQGEITVLCLEGRIAFSTPEGVCELGPMDFMLLRRGEPHALTALEDASALLTICLAQ